MINMDKFNNCYNIAKEILDKYVDFLYSPVYAMDDEMHNLMVDEIRKLILQEYILIHSMTLEEINGYLEWKYLEDDGYDLDVISRLNNKIMAHREIIQGKVITASEINFELVPGNIEFSIYDVLLSMIYIDVIKLLKNKIYSLNATCEKDENFINLLQQRLKISKIKLLFSSFPSEILTLYHNTGIDETPRIDIDMIKNKLKKLNTKEMNQAINNVIYITADDKIDEIINTEKVNNNADDVFDYLVTVTMMEVLISYMDKDTLELYYEYCSEMINDKNRISVENVKRLIKNKMKEY